MDNETVVTPESTPEPVEPQTPDTPEPAAPTSEPVREDEKTPATPQKPEDKTVPYSRFKEVNDELNALKNRPESSKTLKVEDFIDISASLEGLSPAEKAYLAEQHRLTGKPLAEIRKSENFLLWQTGYNAKVEKERALKPSGEQGDETKPKTLTSKLQELNSSKNFRANLAEMEKHLEGAGLYKESRPKSNRPSIG